MQFDISDFIEFVITNDIKVEESLYPSIVKALISDGYPQEALKMLDYFHSSPNFRKMDELAYYTWQAYINYELMNYEKTIESSKKAILSLEGRKNVNILSSIQLYILIGKCYHHLENKSKKEICFKKAESFSISANNLDKFLIFYGLSNAHREPCEFKEEQSFLEKATKSLKYRSYL
jgi:tetratricopeptide (TPR) repeat protein